MPDFGAPVAQNVNVNGLEKLSDVLKLKSQQLLLAGQAAEVQQQQQTAQQRSGIANFMSTFDPTQHIGSDGTLDLDSVLSDPKLRQSAGDQFPELADKLIGIKQHQLQAKQQLVSLNDDTRTQFLRMMGGLRTDPDVLADNDAGRQKVETAIGQFGATGPDAARIANIYAPMVEHAPRGKLAAGLSVAQLQAQDAATQSANQRPTYTDTGTQLVQTSPQAAGGAPSGNLSRQIPPQIVTPPGGIPTAYPGGKGPVASTFPGVQPTTQDIENFGAYQANLNNRVAVASDSIPRIEQAETALNQIRGGHGAQGYAKLGQILQAVGAPQSLIDSVANGSLSASQEAEKYLFQTTFSGLRQAMQGDPARVAEFQSAEQVFPSIGTDPRAAKAVLNFMVDQGKRDFAEQQALNKARKEGSFNPATWQADYQQQLRAGKVPGVPKSQVPTGAKAMPTGIRLQAYADKYTQGDLTKAQAALRNHGYQ